MEKKFQTGKVIAVSSAHLLHDIYSSFLAPLLPLLVGKLGITLSMAGLLDSLKNSPSLFNPFFGLLVDRFYVKYFVIITPAVTAVIMSLLGIAPTYGVVVVMVFVMGVSSTFFHIPSPVLIKKLSADRTATGMSFYMLGGELSRTLGPLLITGAVTLWGLEGTWRLIPFGLAASLVLVYVLRDFKSEKPKQQKKTGEKPLRDAGPLIKMFTPITGFLFFILAMKVSLTLYLPAYLMSEGKSLVAASLSLSVLQFAGALGTLGSGFISDKIGRKRYLYICGTLTPLLMWFFLISGETLRLPLLAALGFFLFAYAPVILAIIQDSETHSPSFVNGLYMTITFVIRTLAVFLVGFFGEKIGFGITYRVAAGMAFGVLPFIFFLQERQPAGFSTESTEKKSGRA